MIRLLRTGVLRSEAMSEEIALHVGLLLAASGTSDVIDAHVVHLARRLGGRVVRRIPAT